MPQDGRRNRKAQVPIDNTRRLVMSLLEALDYRLSRFLRDTQFEDMRKADIVVFVNISRGHDSISKLARFQGISRQAVHMAAQRIKDLKLIDIKPVPGNGRDKVLVLTALGQKMLARGAKEMASTEVEMAAALGSANMERFRELASKLFGYLDDVRQNEKRPVKRARTKAGSSKNK